MARTYNENLEIHVLACLFKDGSLFPVIEDILERKSFGHPSFQIIFQAIKDIIDSDLYPDLVTIEANLDKKGLLDSLNITSKEIKGKDVLSYIYDLEVDLQNLESYAFQVQELHATRQLYVLNDELRKDLDSSKRPIEILSKYDIETGKIAAFIGAQSKNAKDSKSVALSTLEQFEDATNGKGRYIATGLSAWDDFTNGLFPGRLYMVAGRSGDGKSATVIDLIKLLSIDNKIKTKLFIMEMSAEEESNRLVQCLTGISPLSIEAGTLKKEQVEPYKNAIKKISESPIFYDDSPELNLALLRTKIRKSVADGARVVFIDQLENLHIGGSGDSQAEHIRINYMGYRIKAFSREMDVPIVLVHQTNRSIESGQNRGKDVDPQLSDLSQAGEKPCDAVMIIRNNKKGQASYNWVKNRQGRVGKREVNWDGSHITFSDIVGTTEFPDFVQEDFDNE